MAASAAAVTGSLAPTNSSPVRSEESTARTARSASGAVAAEYRGLSVGEMNDLRVKAREKGVYLRVVRNTLARRAVEGTDLECMKDGLVGPLVLAFAGGWMRSMHRKWFDLSDESFAAIHYKVLAYFKLLWIVFNLTPYLALRLFV